jgi:hypothetical protein
MMTAGRQTSTKFGHLLSELTHTALARCGLAGLTILKITLSVHMPALKPKGMLFAHSKADSVPLRDQQRPGHFLRCHAMHVRDARKKRRFTTPFAMR